MEQHTQTEVLEKKHKVQALEAQLRECYGRVVYSHKTHEKCADIYHGHLRLLKFWQIVLSVITTGGLIVTIIGENVISTIVATVTSALLVYLNAYTKEYNLGELAQKHANVAGDLWNVRESYLSLLTDLLGNSVNKEVVCEKRDELQEALKNIYQGAPRTIPEAYSTAQRALKISEELTFSDEEIDNLLPIYLRKTKT